MRRLVLVLALAAAARADEYPSTVLHRAANPSKCFNLIIVPTRFTQSQMATDVTTPTTPGDTYWDSAGKIYRPSFERCAREAVNGLLDHEPFKTYQKAFQVTRVDIASKSDQQGQGTFREEPQRTYIGGIDRTFFNDTELDDNLYYATKSYRADNITLIVNEKKHDGGNFANVNAILYDTDVTRHRYTTTHEMGHGLFGLADEYTENKNFAAGLLAGCPNVDYVASASNTKWAKWVGVSSSVPAQAFQGGGGYKSGSPIWHPTKECLMNNNLPAPYCVVCREASITRIFNRVGLITGTTPPADRTVYINPGDNATFAVQTDYADTTEQNGVVVDWILDGKNLLQRSGKAGGTSDGQGILSLTVNSAQFGYDGDHVLTALVRDAKAHPQTKSQPAEAEWNIKLAPTRRTDASLRAIR